MTSLPISIPAPAEDTLLMSLNTVKLQLVSMKKYLVCLVYRPIKRVLILP